MSKSLVELLCQMKGAELAHKLCVYLDVNDLNCLYDDDDMVWFIKNWECQNAFELANQLNQMMVEKFKGYLELNLVDLDNREQIKLLLEYDETYNPNRPELSNFTVKFNGVLYKDLDKNSLDHLCDTIILFNKMLNSKVDAVFPYALPINKEQINRICSFDNKVVKVPYNSEQNEAFLVHVAKDEQLTRVLSEVETSNPVWTEQVRKAKPLLIMLVEQGASEISTMPVVA